VFVAVAVAVSGGGGETDGSPTTEIPDWRTSSRRSVISCRLRERLKVMECRISFCSRPLRWK
jgi:hypothetical protein